MLAIMCWDTLWHTSLNSSVMPAHNPRILADGGCDPLLDPLAHLLLLLGGHPHLHQPVVGAGRGLEQVRDDVGAHEVILDTERLERGVLVHDRAQGLYSEITQIAITGGELGDLIV